MNSEFLQSLEKQLTALKKDFTDILKRLHTGRAHPSLLDGLTIEINQQVWPLYQLATILAPEAQTLKITPFDQQNINPICEAINADSKLHFNPTDDGRAIYLAVPPLTSERRQQITKQLESQKESFLIRLRQLRHQFLKQIKEAIKGEDQLALETKQLESMITKTKQDLEETTQSKASEILKME